MEVPAAPDVKPGFTTPGIKVEPANGAEFGALFPVETDRWSKIVREAGIPAAARDRHLPSPRHSAWPVRMMRCVTPFSGTQYRPLRLFTFHCAAQDVPFARCSD